MIAGPSAPLNDRWRRQKSRAFDLHANSTAGRTITFPLWGREITVYANANFSIYSAQRCNARCPFCVEELRPAARGISLQSQKRSEPDDGKYFANLRETLDALRPLGPTISITGGEPSKDPRLPCILNCIADVPAPRKTITTNASGLLDFRDGRRVIDHIARANLDHLNISIAHPDHATNIALMRLPSAISFEQLRTVVQIARQAGTRVRLSCVLLRNSIGSLPGILSYLQFAQSLGVDNVIFRQLMKSDPDHHLPNSVVTFSDTNRVMLEPILDQLSDRPDFTFVRQVIGYYYYVEVWRHAGIDVVFEEADLSHLQAMKTRDPDTIHELIFHPSALLASTWQPWDGLLGPPAKQQPGYPPAQNIIDWASGR